MNLFVLDHGGGHGHSHGGVPPPANVRHLTEIVNSNADMALGHNATDTEETDEMVPPKPDKVANNKKQTPCRAAHDPGHMNMKGVFLHILSDALGECSCVVSYSMLFMCMLFKLNIVSKRVQRVTVFSRS